uniref:Uncharacterized protein n=1 Tax=Globisporangium ultimum (strain ATCC 200006 / CBS 805.95 / DAOM BR144) TaxID=431595 RepID=K3WGD2_GLOUD
MSLSGVDAASVMPIEGLFTYEDPSAGPQAARSKRLERQTIPPNDGGIPFFSVHAGRSRDAASATMLPYLHPATTTTSSSNNNDNNAAGSGKTAAPVSTTVFEGFQCAPTSSCHFQLVQLQDEKEFLTKYVERILNQLRVVLQKHGELEKLKALTDPQGLAEQYERMAAETNPDNFEGEEGGESKLPYGKLDRLAPWLTSKEYTNPLLQAYDLKIYELERNVEENKKAMDRIVARAESLARENTSLRQEIEASAEKVMLRMQHEPKDVQLANDDFIMMQENGEYLNEINERIDVLMSENNMLMEQVSLQDDEMCAMRKELTDRDEQLQVMAQNFNQATLALQELRDSCESIRDEKVRCEQQLQQYAATMAQLENRKEVLTQQSEMLHSEHKHLESQMEEYESLLNTVKKNAERKDEIFSNRYQNVCARLRELNSIVEHKERAIDELEEKNRTLQVDLESARQDCEGMLNVLNSMEKQLTQYCNREESVTEVQLLLFHCITNRSDLTIVYVCVKLESDCKAKVEEVILEKEQVGLNRSELFIDLIAARETQSRREIARLLDKLRQQTAEHLKIQEDTAGANKRKHDAELHTREEEVRFLNSEVAQLRVKLEFVVKNQKEAEKKLSDAIRRSKEVSNVFESSHLEAEYLQKLRTKEEELGKLRNEYRERTQELNEKLNSLEREVDMRRTDARELKEETEEKNQRIQIINDELQKVKADCASRFTKELESIHQQNWELKSQIVELEYKLSQSRKESKTALDASRSERERMEVRLVAEVESLKGRISTLKEERTRTEKIRQEAEAKCSVYSLQIQQLTRDLAEVKEVLVEREHACDDGDRKITELSAQLAIALSKQQQFYRQEREMRTMIERLTIEKTRMEREVSPQEAG